MAGPSRSMRMRRGVASDHAATTALTTILMLAMTTSVVGIGAVAVTAWSRPADAPETLTMSATAMAGADQLELLNQGGTPIDAGDLVAVVSVNENVVYRGPAAPPGTIWQPGGALSIPLGASPPPGARAAATIVDEATGAIVASAWLAIPMSETPATTSASFSLTAMLGGSGIFDLIPGDPLRIDVTVEHPEGRKYVRYVYADLSPLGGGSWFALSDDGTAGDLMASDGVFGGLTIVPSTASTGPVTLSVHAVDLDGARTRLDIGTRVPDVASPPAPPAAPEPAPTCFRIRPDGGVEPTTARRLNIEVIGVDITYGADGPRIPVHAWSTLDGGLLSPLYGGAPVARGMTAAFDLPPGSIVGVRGSADYEAAQWHSAYNSFDASPHVRVLKDGDVPPDVPAFGTIQQDIAVYLAPYVQDGLIALAPDEIIVLFEFGSLGTAAADFQDLVILYDFECDAIPADAVAPIVTQLDDPTDVPCSELPGPGGWSELKVDPGRDGVFTQGPLTVTITNYDGKRFDWSSNLGVDAVFVKAGAEGSNLYTYDPEALGDIGLASPGTLGNEISHISFCFDG